MKVNGVKASAGDEAFSIIAVEAYCSMENGWMTRKGLRDD